MSCHPRSATPCNQAATSLPPTKRSPAGFFVVDGASASFQHTDGSDAEAGGSAERETKLRSGVGGKGSWFKRKAAAIAKVSALPRASPLSPAPQAPPVASPTSPARSGAGGQRVSEQVERGLKLVGSSMGVMQEAREALRRHHAARAHLLDMYSDIMAKHLALLDTVKNLEGHAADLAARLAERDALVEELSSQVSSVHEPTWCCS